MQAKLMFVTFNFDCRLHAVSEGKTIRTNVKFLRLVFKTEQIFGFPNTPKGKGVKRSILGVRRSKVKVTLGQR